MSNSRNKSTSTSTPLRNTDGTLNLTHYRNKALTERACAIRRFGKLIQSLVGFPREA